MIKIKIFSTGKIKEAWLQSAIEEYSKRMQSNLSIEWSLFKDEEKLYKHAFLEKDLIVLSPDGIELNSEEFSKQIFQLVEKNQSRLSILIGGAEGIPRNLIKTTPSFSLSRLTWSHQTVRLLIIEQLYRAYEIMKGSAYHK